METTGFIVPFVVKEHFSFTQLLRARAGRDDRVLHVEHQGEHGVNMLISPCTLALGFATGMWTNASRGVRSVQGRRLSHDAAMDGRI